jgi:protein-disulfide isomerase
MPAANAAECAHEQGKFWEMHDKIFENNQKLEDADLEGYARAIGLNLTKFKSCYAASKYKSRIQTDQRTAMMLGARGTPAFFINGRFLSGAQPMANFSKLIDEELNKAKSSGVAKTAYYENQIIAKGSRKL